MDYISKNHSKFLIMVHLIFKTFWSDGYFACSIGNVGKDAIEKYIQNQGYRWLTSPTLKG